MKAANLQLSDIPEKRKMRFWSMVDRRGSNECWPWMGGLASGGYGAFSIHNRQEKTHRVALVLSGVVLSDGLFACHKSDNPQCCNPAHLFTGTSADNSSDMKAKGRAAMGDKHGSRLHPERLLRGESHYRSKLTEQQVTAIRQRRNSGATYSAICREFGIAKTTLGHLLSGRSWKHIPL